MAETFEEYRNDELNNIHIEAEKMVKLLMLFSLKTPCLSSKTWVK